MSAIALVAGTLFLIGGVLNGVTGHSAAAGVCVLCACGLIDFAWRRTTR